MAATRSPNRPDWKGRHHLDPQTLVDAVYRHIDALEGRSQLKSTVNYLHLVATNVEQAIHARENGNFYALHSPQFPIEFFWPLGIMPLSNDVCSTLCGILADDGPPVAPISEGVVFPCDNCSSHHPFFAMADVGAWPMPDFAVIYRPPCDTTMTGQESAATWPGVPSFRLEHPARSFTPQSMLDWIEQHRALLRFLEERTGRTMNLDLLKEAARLSYRATQVYQEVNELRRAVPCPLPAEAACAPMAVYRAWAGTQTCVDFLEQLRDELRVRVAERTGAVPQEKFRYAFAARLPSFNSGISAEMEGRYGAVNVMDHLQWWREEADWRVGPADPVARLAGKVQFAKPNSPHGTEEYVADVRQTALKCKADGVIYINNLCCPQDAREVRALKGDFDRSLGLPWTTVDCDMLDRSSPKSKEAIERLDVFFEAIEQSKSYRARFRRRRNPQSAIFTN